MPDWFYRTVSRPLLFRVPAGTARRFALGFMGRLARLPGGGAVIDFLGHMRPDPRLAVDRCGVRFPAAVGLGPYLDVNAVALPALARFGVGFLTVGPVGVTGQVSSPVSRHIEEEQIGFQHPPPTLAVADAVPKLAEVTATGVPLIVRLATGVTADDVAAVAEHAAVIALEAEMFGDAALVAAAGEKPILCVIALDGPLPELPHAATGVLLDSRVRRGEEFIVGPLAHAAAVERVAKLRSLLGPDKLIVAGGGVHHPVDAIALRDAGADLVEVDSGLVFTGPGLPKRANEAFLARLPAVPPQPVPATRQAWFWALLMGAGMLFGSVLALAIAGTRVVLPYDEQFVGLTREQLAAVNPRLLAFMAHDRVCLAGTMIAVGILYVGLAGWGMRAGLHWAYVAVTRSAFAGFASFFSFLGFGYLDPFHAFVSVVLLQFLLLAVFAGPGPRVRYTPPPPRTDGAWRMAQWGQLLLIGHAVAVLVAGLTIMTVGVTVVFVPEDLEFMDTTAEFLRSAHPRLVPLVAHDRATFGGMLIATGIALLLPALWGIGPGCRWLWATFLAAGVCGYLPAIAVHHVVGYHSHMHLFPAYLGLAAHVLGCLLAGPYLCRSAAAVAAEWPAAPFRLAPSPRTI